MPTIVALSAGSGRPAAPQRVLTPGRHDRRLVALDDVGIALPAGGAAPVRDPRRDPARCRPGAGGGHAPLGPADGSTGRGRPQRGAAQPCLAHAPTLLAPDRGFPGMVPAWGTHVTRIVRLGGRSAGKETVCSLCPWSGSWRVWGCWAWWALISSPPCSTPRSKAPPVRASRT